MYPTVSNSEPKKYCSGISLMQEKTKFIKKIFKYNQVQVFKNPKYNSAIVLNMCLEEI